MPIAPALSSSFGESRTTAFHAGIDIKTWGRTGYEVRAIDDGYIERVRTSPWGYGRAVYQRLSDGRMAVYAHLEAFVGPALQRVRAAQQESMRYSIDLWFKEGEIPVRRGEVIARSGESGAGPPHLHLELRDRDNIPINPLLGDYAIDDATPPVLKRLALVPLGRYSRVDGRAEPFSVALRWDEPSRSFAASDTVQVRGRIGVAVLVWDRAEAAANKLAPHQLGLRVDGQDAFLVSYDRISYADGHQVQLDRLSIDYPGGTGRFHALFRPPGSRLEFYQRPGDGLLRSAVGTGPGFLSEGVHQIEVFAVDANGNRARALLHIAVNDVPSLRTVAVVPQGDGWAIEGEIADGDDALLNSVLYHRKKKGVWKQHSARQVAAASGLLRWDVGTEKGLWKLQVRDAKGGVDSLVCAVPPTDADALAAMRVARRARADAVQLVLHVGDALSRQPRVLLGERVLWPRQIAQHTYEVHVPLGEEPGDRIEAVVALGDRRRSIELDQVAVRPGAAQRIELADREVALDVAQRSAYDIVFPQAERFVPQVPEGLVAVGQGYALGPEDVPFDARVGVWLRCAPTACQDARVGLYQEMGEAQWGLVGSERQEGSVGASLRRLGRFALLRDGIAPEVDGLRPRRAAKTRDRQPQLSARIDDAGSGIGREEDIAIELNGQALIAEYDPEAKTVRARPPQELALGAHEWTVRVRDMAGNERLVRSAFRVVK